MLSLKQNRMLKLLDGQILECKNCSMFNGGRCKPYYTGRYNGIAIIGEAPGGEEVNNIPFCGKAGKKLWSIMNPIGFKREEFFIMNTINCRPTDGKRNLKPNNDSIKNCREWIRKYLKVIKPEIIITLGNYAMGTILSRNSGIIKLNATVTNSAEFGCDVLRCVHPSMCVYNTEGERMLEKSINILKKLKNGKEKNKEKKNDIRKNDPLFWVQTSFI